MASVHYTMMGVCKFNLPIWHISKKKRINLKCHANSAFYGILRNLMTMKQSYYHIISFGDIYENSR